MGTIALTCNGHAYAYKFETDFDSFGALYNCLGEQVARYEPPTAKDEYRYLIHQESGEVMLTAHENELFTDLIYHILAGQYEAFSQ